ncbi:MAG: hypothetical protein LBE22_10415 [Azoarcus sp.]|jgi:hypothetical protein|nr:hypothetical protein [Azoarcus sp.]
MLEISTLLPYDAAMMLVEASMVKDKGNRVSDKIVAIDKAIKRIKALHPGHFRDDDRDYKR